MRLYLVEDNVKKAYYFQPIIDAANKAALDRNISFSDGFEGMWETAQYDPQLLLKAVQDKEGICLIDLDLPQPKHRRALEEIASHLRDENELDVLNEFNRINTKIGNKNYELGLMLLCLCRHYGTKFLLQSTAGSPVAIEDLKQEGVKHILWPWDPERDFTPMINATALKILSLIDVVDELRDLTEGWFKKDYGPGATHLWHTWQPERLDEHREIVKAVWPWFPDSWWGTEASASILHENLKRLCGAGTCWMSDANDARPLSIGAAYLLVSLVMEHRFPGWVLQSPEHRVNSFEGLNDSILDWLPRQGRDVAEKSLRAFVDLVQLIAVSKDDVAVPSLTSVVFSVPGRSVAFGLSWDGRGELAKKSSSLITVMEQEVDLSSPPMNTFGGLLKFEALRRVNRKGFGAPGYMYIEERTLYVGA